MSDSADGGGSEQDDFSFLRTVNLFFSSPSVRFHTWFNSNVLASVCDMKGFSFSYSLSRCTTDILLACFYSVWMLYRYIDWPQYTNSSIIMDVGAMNNLNVLCYCMKN